MGYKLLYDKQILFDVYYGDYVTDAQLSMSVNSTSYFDFTISLTHSLYNIVAEHAGIVELYFDNAKLFSGEITEISVDLNGNKDITCAGALDYLSYTLVRPYSTVDGEAGLLAPSSVDGYFNWLIEQHNKHCLDSRKHFFVGVNQGNLLDNNNYIYRASSELPTTSSEIEDKILNSVGGYLYVRYKDDKNILDLYADTHEANTQIIDFGVNITDFVKTTSTDDQYTAVIATGYTPDPPEDDPQKKMTPITLEGCVDGGTPYSPSIVKMGDVVYDVNAVARYGYKEYHVSNDDIKTYDGLLQYACKVLNKLLSPSLSVSVKAVDLSLYMKDKYEHMQVGQAVRVRSKLHNIDEYLVVNSITLDMNNPENTEYQLGESYDTLTGQQSSYLRSLNSSIVSNLDSVAKLDSETKKNAKDIADTKVVASNAANKANEANNKADVATNTANSANTKANEANAKAETATNTANSANTKADEAKADAANANSKADDATEIANSANTKADQATDLANSAKQEASTASNIASEAKKTADKAQADTNTNTKAVAQAQSTADAAKKAAADAQEKAENVESNLESANAVIEQHSNKLGELSTKVSNAVTNANSALTTSTEAKQTATEASTTANTAYKDSQTAITNSTKATQTAIEAKTTAESAVSTANDSLRQSSSAVQTANRIENTLTTEYQTKADSDALYATKSSLTETSESIKMEVSATYATKSTVEALQNVADNAIESWRGSGVPTSENKPASNWTTIEEKKRHSGDLYYDKDTGKAYRWGSDDGVIYSWVLNQDTDITKALQDASNAQKSANAAQSTANGAVTAAGNAQKSADGAQSTADSAKTAAANAQKTADTAQLDVDQLKIDIPGTYATKASLETTAESITAQVESVSTTANSAVTAASKAQQTADAINVNLTKNYQTKENADNTYATKASLSATSEGLSASITKAQQTADGAVNAASNAQQTADAININLTKNYQTTKDADDKYATQSSLNATADSITASVSKTYSTKTELTSAIDGISVGSRNYIANSLLTRKKVIVESYDIYTGLWTITNTNTWAGGVLLYKTKTLPKGTYSCKFGKNIQGFLCTKQFGNSNIWVPNKYYSEQFDSGEAYVVNVNQGTPFEGFTATEEFQFGLVITGPVTSEQVGPAKLELGNKPTDWSPAPEDLVNESKTYTDAQIKVSADSINSTVSSVKTTADSALSNANSALDQINEIPGTYATKTEVNQTATDLTTTITTAQNTANDAKGAADSAQTTANEAKGTADSAKTSTNVLETLIRQSGDGVEVAKKVNDEYTSTKTLMGPDGFYIKDLTDTALTQVKSDSIIIGKETESHMHINPDDVTISDGNEKELAKFYGNGLSINSDALDIYSGQLDVPSGETIPITYMNAVGGFSFYSMLNDSIQTILPRNSNNKCMIAAVNDVHSNPSGYTVASSAINIKVIANAEGETTNADSTASISIDSHSTLLNSSSNVSTGSTIVFKASDINLQAQRDLIIKGYTLKDFVKDFGTSTTKDSQWPTRTWEWRWIKTYSGKCFAWGECGFNIGCTNAWGSGYYDHVCPVYPFKLTKWNVQASVSFLGGGIGHTGIYDDSATQCPIYIWSAVYQNTGTMFVKVFVEGVLA